MADLTRQEVQNVIDNARNRIVERLASRQDVQTICDGSRDRIMSYLHDLMQVNQQNIIRRQNAQKTETTRRMLALETRMASMEQELKVATSLLQQLANQQPQQVIMPVMPEDSNNKYTPEQKYAYRLE